MLVSINTTAVPTPHVSDDPNNPGGQARRRPPGPAVPREPNPSIRHVTVDGEQVLAVGLAGRFGQGREMLISVRDWERISPTAGTVWPYNRAGSGRWQVVSGTHAACAALNVEQRSKRKPKTALAHLVVQDDTRLDRSRAVVYRNGNPLDLRRGNLEVIPRRELLHYQPTRAPVEVLDGWAA